MGGGEGLNRLNEIIMVNNLIIEPRRKKTGLRGFRPGCTTTEDGWRVEISDLGSRGIVLSVYRKQRR